MPPTSSSVPSPSAASPASGCVTGTTTAWMAPMNPPTAVSSLRAEGWVAPGTRSSAVASCLRASACGSWVPAQSQQGCRCCGQRVMWLCLDLSHRDVPLGGLHERVASCPVCTMQGCCAQLRAAGTRHSGRRCDWAVPMPSPLPICVSSCFCPQHK